MENESARVSENRRLKNKLIFSIFRNILNSEVNVIISYRETDSWLVGPWNDKQKLT